MCVTNWLRAWNALEVLPCPAFFVRGCTSLPIFLVSAVSTRVLRVRLYFRPTSSLMYPTA
jgi:hypothetical protein